MHLLRASAALAIVFSVAACSGGDDSSDPPMPGAGGTSASGSNGPVAIGPDGLPVGPDGQPLPTKLDGRYELSNKLDLTSAGIFPDMANDTLKALSDFREHPSSTIVELLEAAKVPVVSNVLSVVPSLIRDYVLGYIDDHVFKALNEKVPVTKELTGMLDDLASLATQFEVVSTLDVPPGNAMGDANGTHQVTGIAYNWSQKRTVIYAPDVLTQFELQKVKINAVGLDKRSPDLESGRLALGDHAFKVPIGSFAVYAADKLVQDKYGAKNLLDAVAKVVDCADLAKDVAARCIGVGPAKVCVGHESDIKNICDLGLNVIVSNVQAKIKDLDIPALHLKSGTAKMWDAPADKGPLDAVVSRLDNGFWTAGVGPQDKQILAVFSGVRVADYGQNPK